MTCEGQSPDVYELFAIGALEGEERKTIEAHLEAGCETCLAGVRRRLAGWSQFAEATAPEEAPPAWLRARVLASVGGAAGPRRVWFPAWAQALAACLLLAVGASIGWFSHIAPPTPERAASPAVAPALPPAAPAAQTAGEIVRLTALVERERQAAAEARRLQVSGEAALAEARGRLSEAEADVSRAQARAAALQSQLDQDAPRLAAEQQARRDAEVRLAQAEAERDRSQRRERDMAARAQLLERQVASLREAADAASARLQPMLKLAALASSPSLRTLRLQAAEAYPGISGNAFVVEGSAVLVYAAGLPPLKPGRTYQLWLMRSRSPGVVSGGVFQPGPGGSAVIEVSSPSLATAVNTVAVTDEPAGGSKLPTGTKFFIGVKG